MRSLVQFLMVLVMASAAWVWGSWPSSAAQDVLGAGPRPSLDAAPSQKNDRGLPFYNDASFTPSWTARGAHVVAPFTLTDQTGRPFGERDLDGKITVVAFFYTTCHSICSTNAKNLGWLQQRLAGHRRLQIASHSVTGDSQAALARYARANAVDARRWHLLSGDTRVLDALMRTSYFTYPAGDVGPKREAMHTENLLLIDGQRRIRGIYRGTLRVDVEELARDVQRLEAE